MFKPSQNVNLKEVQSWMSDYRNSIIHTNYWARPSGLNFWASQVTQQAKEAGISLDDIEMIFQESLLPYLGLSGVREELMDAIHQAYSSDEATIKAVEQATFTGSSLLAMEFLPISWVVNKILPEGLAVLAAPPKTGKSGLSLHLAASVATGSQAMGHFAVEQGGVIYFALEDSPRRIKDRLARMHHQDAKLENLQVEFEHPTLNLAGLEALEAKIQACPNCKLVIIDTYARVSPDPSAKRNAYDNDYKSLAPLQTLAMKYHIAVIIVTHFRKQESDDVLHKVMGSTGITGVADTIMVLKRKRGGSGGSLYVTGRDVEEEEYALQFEPNQGFWTAQGKAKDFQMSQERREILQVLESVGEPISPKEVAEALAKPSGNIKMLMASMLRDNQLTKVGHGQYRPPKPSDDSNDF